MGAHSVAAWIAAFFLASSLFSGTVALRLLLLFSGAALCAWVAFRARTVRKLPPLWIPFTLWAAWSAATLLWSIDADRSAKELRNEVFYTGLAFWMCYVAAQARAARYVIPAVVAAGIVAACAIGLYYFLGDPWEYSRGAHGGSGNHSSLLLFLMPAALVGGLNGFKTRRTALLAASVGLVVLFAFSGYATLNRTLWLGFGMQFLIVLALDGAFSRARGKLILALTCVAVGAGTGALAWKAHVDRASYGGVEVEKDLRFKVWPEAIERIAECPLTGYGFGRGLLRAGLTQDANSAVAWHSHNLFLDTLLQSGAIGMGLLLLLLAATLHHAWRLTRRSEPVAAACGIVIIGMVAGMLVRNMTDVLLVRHIALFYWGFLGVLLAWGREAPPPA